MKLAPDWLKDADIVRLMDACAKQDIMLRFVGGAVRDTLLMREVRDVDAATPVPAAEVMQRLRAEGMKIVPTGLAHGTVTAILPKRQVEITTLRIDAETDGRHAKVAPTDDWEVDAHRRDFSMNALYLSVDGELFDYHEGAEDALAGRVRFIGDAGGRIAEDGLRILRFFRFLATHGEPPADVAALAACRDAHWMLEDLSGERIASEMKKLLLAPNPTLALRLMEEANVAAHVFLQPLRLGVLTRLTMLEHTAKTRASVWGRLVALFQNAAESGAAEWIAQRWKLSRKEARVIQALCALPRLGEGDAKHLHTRIIRREGIEVYRDVLLLSAAENGAFDLALWLEMAEAFAPPVFPITGEDVRRAGIAAGPEMGAVLERLEEAWEVSDYTLTKEALLALV